MQLVASMEAAEQPRTHQRHQERAGAEGDDVAGVPWIEVTDPADKEVAYDDTEEPPEHVDRRRGESLPRWLGERALERPAQHAARRVRDGVGEERAAQEVRQEMKPRHLRHSWVAADR